MMAIIGTFTYEFQVSLPLIAETTFKGDATSYAILTAAMGLGAAIGGIFFASRSNSSPFKLVGASVLFGFAVLAAAFMPSLTLTGLVMVLVGVVRSIFPQWVTAFCSWRARRRCAVA